MKKVAIHEAALATIKLSELRNFKSWFFALTGKELPVYEVLVGIYEEMKAEPRYRITTEVLSITGPYSVRMES